MGEKETDYSYRVSKKEEGENQLAENWNLLGPVLPLVGRRDRFSSVGENLQF